MTVQTDGSSLFSRRWNVFSDRRLSRSADDRLFHAVGPWKVKLRWYTDVCTLGRSTHPVDAERSRGRPWTTGTQNSCRWRCDAVCAFPYEDRSLENDPSPAQEVLLMDTHRLCGLWSVVRIYMTRILTCPEKRLSRDHVRRGRPRARCRIVRSDTIVWLTTEDEQPFFLSPCSYMYVDCRWTLRHEPWRWMANMSLKTSLLIAAERTNEVYLPMNRMNRLPDSCISGENRSIDEQAFFLFNYTHIYIHIFAKTM